MTSDICMAKASRSGKPAPHALTSSPAGTPMASPATNTSTVAASANTNASGSHRSATRDSAPATRDKGPSVTTAVVSRPAAQREDRQLGLAEEAQRHDRGADAARDVDRAERRVVPAGLEAARPRRRIRRAAGAADLAAVGVAGGDGEGARQLPRHRVDAVDVAGRMDEPNGGELAIGFAQRAREV